MKYKRVFLTVLDSFGIGNAPDAELFGDLNADTLKAVFSSPLFRAECLKKLGLFNISTIDFGENEEQPLAQYGALTEISAGKDTTTGHFEIAGLISTVPMPTFPHGFPGEIISAFEQKIGRKVLCNKPYSGTKVIADYGKEHLKTGYPIVYTSADSVFQIAAHTDIIPLGELYDYCKAARELLTGKYAVSRVIARPFTGEYPFTRTADRRDFSVEPFGDTMLDKLKRAGFDVISIGKIGDIFAHRGFTQEFPTHSNDEGMSGLFRMLGKEFTGLCFANLVDFDMKYGHRRDIDGYAAAISRFDEFLKDFIKNMNNNDLLIITADHGCDPSFKGTDHTREQVPLIIYSPEINSQNLCVIEGYDYISRYVLDNFNLR